MVYRLCYVFLAGSLLKLTRDKRGCWVLQQALETSEGTAEFLERKPHMYEP